jgi:ADP-ribosylglycohydrolase
LRCKAALAGVAVGDAFGKMTEGYWPPEIEIHYGVPVTSFKMPVQKNSKQHWAYAEVTDDTRFTILIAESILACGEVNEADIIRRILEKPIKGWPGWHEYREQALKGLRTARTGNGAPMRVSPIGILHRSSDLEAIVRDVEMACRCNHNSRSALASACAVAGAFSAAIDDLDQKAILDTAIEAADLGNRLGEEDLCPDVTRRLRWVRQYASKPTSRFHGLNPGFNAWEGAVFALALVYQCNSAKEAILAAANYGGDADSIASMAGGILAAKDPEGLPAEWVALVERENGMNLQRLTEQLLVLRR